MAAAAVISCGITLLIIGNHSASPDGSASSSQASDARAEGSSSADGSAGSTESSGDDSSGVIDAMHEAKYAVVVFDQDTDVTCGMSGDPGMDTRKTKLINLGTNYIAQMQVYDSKPVTVAIDPERTCWLSEVTVAGGCPGVIRNASVLG